MIERNPRETARSRYDILIVGGGIHGVSLTLEAARRGLKPLLVERDDFGGATSWNSLRIVHGGLRYLQSLDLHRFRESVAERRWWLATFPDLVAPLPCLMPLHGDGMKRPAILGLALRAEQLLSRGRNEGVRSDRALPPGRILSPDEAVEWFPAIRKDRLRGAALWHDAVMPEPERLLMEMLRWAVACGARALNYVEVLGLIEEEGAVAGLRAREAGSSERLELRAPLVVNCAGPWCGEVARRLDREPSRLFAPFVAFNALLDRAPPSEAALAVTPPAPEGRTYFLYPWRKRILAGTYHAPCGSDSMEGPVDPSMIRTFIGDLNAAIPSLDLSGDSVLRICRGILPARAEGGTVQAVRERIVNHAELGGPAGLFSVSGVKYTTARLVAEKTLRRIHEWKGAPLPTHGGTPRPGAVELPPADRVLPLAEAGDPALAGSAGELLEKESVVHLDDLILRRTDWGFDPRAGLEIGAAIAPGLGWEPGRAASEIDRLKRLIT